MRVTVTGASGLIGSRLVQRLRSRGDEVTVLSRNPSSAGAVRWDPEREAAPASALDGRDAVVHLAGEPVAQRWSDEVKERIRSSRELGTRNLVDGLRAIDARPQVLVSSSAVGYYGSRGDEVLDEDSSAGEDFLAQVCVIWEAEARRADELGLRVVTVRTGVVLDSEGGALEKMLPFFKLGIGGPVAGGRQYMPWIHADDMVGIYERAIDDTAWSGAVNASTPEPVTNKVFSKALGRALHRPALAPVPGLAVQALYGQMAEIITASQRVVPRRLIEQGYSFAYSELDEALRSALES